MGLFSSKKKVVVGTSVQRVIPDDNIPDAIESGTIKAILRSGEIHEEVVDSLTASVGVRADRMYSYADKKYTWGLPSGEFQQASQGTAQIQAILDAAEGTPVEIEYANFGSANSLHIGWMQLVSLYGYNPTTNELPVLSAQKGFPVFLQDMAVVVPADQLELFAPGALVQWGIPATSGPTPKRPRASALVGALRKHTPVETDTAATDDYLKVTVVWHSGNKQYPTEILQIPVPGSPAEAEADYFHVKYAANGVTKYWLYRMGEGTYPTLDALFDVPAETNGTYFPFLYFRFNKQKQNTDQSTEAYKTSKRMAKYLGMNYDTVTDTIDENPDIGDVAQAMLMLAVPANTTNSLEQRYLFDFFSNLNSSQQNQDFVPGMDIKFMGVSNYRRASMVIQDKRFKMVLSYQEVFKQKIVGSVGAVGSYSSGSGTKNVPFEYVSKETGEAFTRNDRMRYHQYRFQKTPNTYEEITVVGLQVLYYVEGSHKVTADETDDILLIPLDQSVTKEYSISDREQLYSRAMHYVFNSMQIIKIKWYQTGIFQVFMLFVAIAMAVYDGGATLGAFLGLQGAAAILATIVVNLIIGELLKVVFKLFAKVFGAEFAMLVAIVALVTASYQVFQSGSLQGAPWAQDLLMVANGLSNAALEVGYSALMADQNSFLAYMEEQNKLLETANELLENKTALNPFVIFGESPTDYFNRTVHSGNIGVFGIEAVAQYTEIALTLPKLNDTLGDVL